MRGILRSRVLLVLCDLIKDVSIYIIIIYEVQVPKRVNTRYTKKTKGKHPGSRTSDLILSRTESYLVNTSCLT